MEQQEGLRNFLFFRIFCELGKYITVINVAVTKGKEPSLYFNGWLVCLGIFFYLRPRPRPLPPRPLPPPRPGRVTPQVDLEGLIF